MVSIYVNKLLCFDKEMKAFYSHLELVYHYQNSQKFSPILFLNEEFFLTLKPSLDKHITNQTESSEIIGNIIKEDEEESKLDTSVNMIRLAEDQRKNSFEAFAGSVDINSYKYKLSLKEFVIALLDSSTDIRRKACLYNQLKDKGYLVDSGSSYGFDFLLYEIQKDSSKNHVHSNFALVIAEENSDDLQFVDLHRKHKIANNYKKVN